MADPPADLIARLTDAACAAIANERPSLESGPGQVRGLTVELQISGSGAVTEATSFVERRIPFSGRRSVR